VDTAAKEAVSSSEQPPIADCHPIAPLTASAMLDIVVEPLPTLPSVQVLLVQIFQNLLSNSLKYRSDAEPVVRVKAERRRAGWIFSVQDNGIGIDTNQLEYVFGVFKRLHGRDYSGTGIGLAICKAAVERLGGRIWVQPQVEAGTTIQFFLPEESPCV
jgi:light-regulated signal transduction histidine kinase (bacteriophytochrome)